MTAELRRKIGANKFVIALWSWVWRKRLAHTEWCHFEDGKCPYDRSPAKVIRVDGWRTALLEPPHRGRQGTMWMFKIWKDKWI